MPVTFDAVGPNSNGLATSTTPYSWSHTLAADATFLVVGLSCGTDGRTLTVTAGGVAMTTNAASTLWKRHTNDGTAGFGQIYVLPAPPTGTITIAVSGQTTGDRISGGSLSFRGTPLDSTAFSTPVSAAGQSATPSVGVPSTSSATMVVSVAAAGNGFASATAPATLRWSASPVDANSGAGNSEGQTAPGTGSTVTMACTITSDFWAIFGLEVQAGAAPPGAPPAQPGGRAWRRRYDRSQVPVVAVSQDVTVTAGLATATGTAGDVAPATTMTPTPPQQLGGGTWKRHWRNPMVPWYRFQEQPYIVGLAGGGRGYFIDQYGNPRLVWGDAVWALCGNVGRWNGGNWRGDFDQFTANRAAQGFTVLYGKPMGTLQSSNIDNNGGTFDSLFPFQGGAPSTGTAGANPSTGLTEAYWQRIDYFLAACKAKGITFFMNAVGYASDFVAGGSGPLAGKSTSEFQAYGTALGNRYKNQPNLVWMVADDYFGGSDDNLLNSFLTGLRAAGDAHVISIENMPESTARNTLDATPSPLAWGTSNAQFHFTYSYNQEYYGVERAYAEGGTSLPVIQGDGYFYQGSTSYAGGSGAFAYDQAFRQAAWWSLAAGARGKVHGSESIWQYQSTALASSATDWFYANNALAIRTVVESLAGWQNLFPDLNNQLVTAGRGTRASAFASGGGGGQYEPAFTSSYVAASVTPDHSLALLYLPRATTITVDVSQLGQGFTANWIDPVTGAASPAGSGPAFNSTAQGNNSQGDPDWVLVLQGPAVTASSVIPPQPGSDLWRSRFRRAQQPMAAPAAASTDLQVSAGLATATGAALSPGLGLTPPAPSGTGSSFAPGIGLQGGSASSSGVAQAPGVQLATGLASGASSSLAPGVGLQGGSASSSGVVQSPGVQLAAGLASGTGSAQAGQAGSGGNAGLAAGTGTASAAGVQLGAGLASGTGTAQPPQAGSAANTTAAGSTGSAFAPGIGLQGGSASSSGVAQAPGVQLGAGLAGGSGTAASEGVGLTPGLATGAGTAFNPGTSIGGNLQVNAGLATGTGTAFGPGIGLQGGSASSSGAAGAPGVQLAPGLAHGTGNGQAVAPQSAASAATATGTGTAQAPQAGDAATAGVATGAGAVQGASRALTPALASAAGTAQSPSLAVTVSAQFAHALGQVLNATAQGQAAVIKGSSSATTVTEPMMSTGTTVTQPAQATGAGVSKTASSQGGVT